MTVPVLVLGQSGRMAQALIRQITATPGLQLAGILPGRDATLAALIETLAATHSDAVICDFSHPSSLRLLVAAMQHVPRRLVTGTSGLDAADDAALADLSYKTAVFRGRNFSLGAVIARALIRSLGQLSAYDPVWQAAVLDFHHARKLDDESATARDWAATWRETKAGRTAPIASIRLGDAISEHQFIVAGCGERVEIAHRLLSFDAPVAGALAAVRFVAQKSDGLYGPDSLLQNPNP